jgi:malonyl-CoA O-methyltransferase
MQAARPFARRRIDALEAEFYREAMRFAPRRLTLAERLDRRVFCCVSRIVQSLRCVSRTLQVPWHFRRGRSRMRPADVDPPPMRALRWIRDNQLLGGGIRVQSGHSRGYPEVTGYLIPTLLDYGETDLATDLTRWLLDIQRPDGSFPDPDQGRSYVFDTGQVLRGLLAAARLVPEAEAAARRAADYLCTQMIDGGAGGFPAVYSGKWWVETAQLYVLPPLVEAAEKLGRPDYRQSAERCLEYYLRHPAFLRIGDLTHFLAYQVEALIDLGRTDLAQGVLDQLRARQRSNGAVRGAGGRLWVCIPGLAQLAVCWYKLGQWEPADRALDWVERHQRPDGGFRGSSGLGASYKQDVEVSWGPKYYLDAHLLRVRSFFNRQAGKFPAEVSPQDGRLRAILACVGPGHRVLEAGCGKGRFLKAIQTACPGVECTGVDPSPALAAHLPAGIRRVSGRLESIPLPDENFDLVFSVEAIEHSANPRRAVGEMARVARPGGWLMIIDKQKSHWGRLECPSWEHWPEIDELKRLLEEHCEHVSAEPVSYDDHPADGLMIAWKGRKKP